MTLYFAIVIWVTAIIVASARMHQISVFWVGSRSSTHSHAIGEAIITPVMYCFVFLIPGGLIHNIWPTALVFGQVLIGTGIAMVPLALFYGCWKAQAFLNEEEVASLSWLGPSLMGSIAVGLLVLPVLLNVWSSN